MRQGSLHKGQGIKSLLAESRAGVVTFISSTELHEHADVRASGGENTLCIVTKDRNKRKDSKLPAQ